MGYDPFWPVSLAQINVLCVPAGRITAAKFDEFQRALQAFSIVSQNSAEGRAILSPVLHLLTVLQGPTSFSRFRDGHVLFKIDANQYQDDSYTQILPEPNAKPQIVVGLIDGETESVGLHSGEQWLQSTNTAFRHNTQKINDVAVFSLIVIGGGTRPDPEQSLFVDLDGDGPSISEVVQELVFKLQSSFDIEARQIERPLRESTSSREESRTSAVNGADRASESTTNQSGRVESPSVRRTSNISTTNERDDVALKASISLGLLNLQAGQWPEALRLLSEGAAAARTDANHLWHAKALEALLVCMLLFAWARLDFNIPQVCYSASDRKGPQYISPSMSAICTANRSATESVSSGRAISSAHTLTLLVPQLLNNIISLYEQAAGIFQDKSTFRVLSYSRVRWGNLLLIAKRHSSVLHDAALQELVEGDGSVAPGNPQDPPTITLILHAKALTKLFVDSALEAQSRLPTLQAAQVQIAVASSLSALRVERKQAFYLKEFLQRLGPALIEARRIGAAEVGIHPSASLPPLDLLDNSLGQIKRSGIRMLLDSVCESYGLDVSRDDTSASQASAEDELRKDLYLWLRSRQAGDVMLKVEILKLCIEVSDAVPDLQSSLDFMSRLLQMSISRPTMYANVTGEAPLISSGDQYRLIHGIRKAVNTSALHNLSAPGTKYWDSCLVRGIDVSEESNTSRLMLRTARDLSLASISQDETRKDPFIFNPFAKAKGDVGQSVVVVGERARFNVLLQNPLQVDVEIEDITLATEGCDFESDRHSIVLGPLCSQIFTMTGRARQEGSLVVTGCHATIRGCHTDKYLIVQGDWKPLQTTKSLTSSTSSQTFREIELPKIARLSLKAAAPLPRLSILSTTLQQQSIMLLEGETIFFRMTVQNESDLDIDFVLLTFEDSVTRRLEEALSNKDLLPADLYEIQNQIATRPVIRSSGGDDGGPPKRIAARQTATFSLELFGRPGLTDVSVLIDYAHLGKPKTEIQEPFYTRQLRHTIATTINGSIDIPRCSIIPLDSDSVSLHNRDVGQASTDLSFKESEGSAEGSHCILLLDVRNIWPQPLVVDFQASRLPEPGEEESRWKNSFTASGTLQPGQMERLLVVVPRILITNPYTPIPSLDSQRQFVVSASKMTIEAEAASRESFWYREQLLKCLRATWKEQKGERQGRIDLRKGIRLTSRMIDALRIDLVDISFSMKLTQPPSGQAHTVADSLKQIGPSHFSLPSRTFASLFTHVHNRSAEELKLLIRLQPSLRNQPHNIALDLSKRFAWTGVLQKALHPPIKPGQSREVELGVIALTEGEYEVNGTVEEIKSRVARTETAILEVDSGVERRIWHARTPCLIDAVDAKEMTGTLAT